jgi:hypothetical protein
MKGIALNKNMIRVPELKLEGKRAYGTTFNSNEHRALGPSPEIKNVINKKHYK